MYLTIAKQWSKVMLALFAVGVVTGTILSFELGMLWPGFMPAFGEVFGLGVALEGFSFFLEAIFIAIYVTDGSACLLAFIFLPVYPFCSASSGLRGRAFPLCSLRREVATAFGAAWSKRGRSIVSSSLSARRLSCRR